MAARPASIILGTRNQKKRTELAGLVSTLGISVISLDQMPDAIEVEEDGVTFTENAQKKARVHAARYQAWVLGEDSGLVVDALQGAPGVYSSRFAGANATDDENNQLLLERLQGVPQERRQAHYVCHVSLARPDGEICIDTEESCRGRIRTSPCGQHGFGYDPLFEVLEYHATFGELGPAIKSAISHRGRAMRAFIHELAKLPN